MKRRFLSGLPILWKLLILSGLYALSLGLVVSVSSWVSRRLVDSNARQRDRSTLVFYASEVKSQALTVQLKLQEALNVEGGGSGANAAVFEIKSGLSLAEELLVKLGSMWSTGEGRSLLDEIGEFYKTYSSRIALILGVVENDAAGARAALPEAASAFMALDGSLKRLVELTRKEEYEAFETARASDEAGRSLIIAVSAATLVLIGIGVWLTVLSIARPLRLVVRHIEKVGTGNLRELLGISGKDEVGRIGRSLDGLSTAMRSLVGTVQDKVDVLDAMGHELASNMEETAAAVAEIDANVASTGNQLAEQDSVVGEVSRAAESFARSVESLGSSIGQQRESLGESAASVEEMIGSVDTVARAAEVARGASERLADEGQSGRTRIGEVTESVESIVRYSQNLGEAARIITEIAERTNLLAMNAAIEAAHAGDSGRGFSVVADEIRKLSEQATEQAGDISASLERVSAAIESVRGSSSKAVGSFGSILEKSSGLGDEVRRISDSMAEQREGGRHVLEGLGHLKDRTREIGDGSGAMASGNAAMLGQVDRLRGISMMVVQNNLEIRQGTKEIHQVISATTELSERNASLIGEVRTALAKFQV